MSAREAISDLLVMSGFSSIVFGAWLIYEPSAYLIGGALAGAAGWLIGRGGQ
jgi:hypothetical protein